MIELAKAITVDTLYSEYEQFHESDFRFQGESHNFWELIYVIEGSLGVAVSNRVYEVNPGQVIFFAPMEFHSNWAVNGEGHHTIVLSFSISGITPDLLTRGVFDLSESDIDLIIKAHKAAKLSMEFESSIQNQRVSNYLEELILNLLEKETPVIVQKKNRGTENYKRIIKVMTDNIDENLSSEQIAERCGLGISNLKRIIKKYSGMGVMQCYNNLRVLRAIELIQSGGKSMQEISNTLNFSSQNYFTEVFKRETGFTPTRYKRNFTKT